MKNVACFLRRILVNLLLLKNSVICILEWFKLLSNYSPERVLMLLFSCVYDMLDLRTLKIAFTASLYDGPIYFNCYPNLTLALDDPNIVKALTLNIASSCYHMEEGSKPFALIYRIYYRLLGT